MTTVASALQHLDSAGMRAFLTRFVQIPSVYLPDTAGANESAAATLVADVLTEWGLNPTVWEVQPGRPNIVAELRGSHGDGPILLMEGHTDVVTPGNLANWTYPPFAATIVGDRMYGRGTADMKGGVAAMLYAVRALQLAGSPFAGTIRLLIPVDEEGLMIGIKDIVARGYATGAAAAIICEPEEHEVCTAQKGALRLKLHSIGRVAHGAMPDEGVNALTPLIRLLNPIIDLQETLRAAHGQHPLLGSIYISPTVLRAPIGGDASQVNVLPDSADVYLDIRTIPGVNHQHIVATIQGYIDVLCQKHPSYQVQLTIIDDRPSTEIPTSHPLVQALRAAHQTVYGVIPPYGGVPGSTDGTIITRDSGVPVVVYGPGHKRIPHQPDEFVDLSEVDNAARVYIHAILQFLSTNV